MQYPVLVPYKSKPLFQNEMDSISNPICYIDREESLSHKIIRRLGFRDLSKTMEAIFNFPEGADHLEKTYAFWLSPGLYLPSPLMECLLDRMPGLQWVFSQVTGTDHIDIELFRKRKIMVSNAGDLNSRRVAEMALACIFAHSKRLHEHFALQRLRMWKSLPADDLYRQTVGIVGTGNIGRNVATLCRALGMHIVGASRDPARFGNNPFPYHRFVRLHAELETLLSDADHVILALPLNNETHGIIGREQFRAMKRSASLINLSRGPIVDESELCKALADGTIGGAYIERPSRLPPLPWNKLYRAPNLVFTHYSAVNSPFLMKEAFDRFIEGIRCMMESGRPPNRVV